LRTWQWYALWAIFFLNVSAGLAIISDAKAMAASLGGASATLASAFVVMVAVADSTGRLFWHALSDKVGQSTVFQAMFFLQAAAFSLLLLLGAGSFAVFCALSFVALSCYGGGYGTMPAFVNAYYGSGDVGTIYASIITASGLAGFGVPLLLALTADATGSYGPALYATAVLMLVDAAIPLTMRPPSPPTSRDRPSLAGAPGRSAPSPPRRPGRGVGVGTARAPARPGVAGPVDDPTLRDQPPFGGVVDGAGVGTSAGDLAPAHRRLPGVIGPQAGCLRTGGALHHAPLLDTAVEYMRKARAATDVTRVRRVSGDPLLCILFKSWV